MDLLKGKQIMVTFMGNARMYEALRDYGDRMDEPFGAVDEITRKQLQKEMKAIHQKSGITVLFVTHDIEEALSLGTKVLVINAGKIEQFAAPKELLKNPATEFVRNLVANERRSCILM